MNLFKEKTPLAIWSLTLSVFTVMVFHGPFFRQLRINWFFYTIVFLFINKEIYNKI